MQSNQEPEKIEELPSRATKHKQQAKTFKLGISWPKRKRADQGQMAESRMDQKSQPEPAPSSGEADTPRELAFYEALQSVREQASAVALTTDMPAPAKDARRLRFPSGQVILGGLLGLSLIANLGEGYVIYNVMKLYAAEKNRYAIPLEEKTQPAPEPQIAPVRQAVTWDEGQRSMLSKEERTDIESRLSALLTPDVMQSGALNFVFVPGLNHLAAQHDGGVALSAFFHNGFMKAYLPHQIKITATYEGKVILDHAFENTFNEWAPSDVRLIEFAFSYDDVRDAKLLDELMHDTEKQQKIKFDVKMAYQSEKFPTRPDLKEDVWVYLNPHTLTEKPAAK
ncbi:MAG: hypothetical protein WCC10_00735 [Tumebacillaceae bacterium]